jgi:hypothetical protein
LVEEVAANAVNLDVAESKQVFAGLSALARDTTQCRAAPDDLWGVKECDLMRVATGKKRRIGFTTALDEKVGDALGSEV